MPPLLYFVRGDILARMNRIDEAAAAFNEEITKRTVGGVLSTERDKVVLVAEASRIVRQMREAGIKVVQDLCLMVEHRAVTSVTMAREPL